MTDLLYTAVSFLNPWICGWMIVGFLWPACPRMLRASLGVGLGLGLAGSIYMLSLLAMNSALRAVTITEFLLLTSSAALFIRARLGRRIVPASFPPLARSSKLATIALVLCGALGFSALAFMVDVSRHGGWDAVAIWNVKARFFYLAERPADVLKAVELSRSQLDYPVLLPSLVARGWQYAGRMTVLVPGALAIVFTMATFVLAVAALRVLAPGVDAMLGGCLLIGTPFFLRHGVSQYADIAMCLFVTAAVMLLSIASVRDAEAPRLRVLAGLFAGFAMCTKNEGLLFVLVLAVAQLGLAIRQGRATAAIRAGAAFGGGVIPGLLAFAIFKLLYSPPNQIVAGVTVDTAAANLVDWPRHLKIITDLVREGRGFGEWWINPAPLLFIYFLGRYAVAPIRKLDEKWLLPGSVLVLMALGYYGIYLMSPYDVDWHIQTSLSRLILQLWPTILMFYCLLLGGEKTSGGYP